MKQALPGQSCAHIHNSTAGRKRSGIKVFNTGKERNCIRDNDLDKEATQGEDHDNEQEKLQKPRILPPITIEHAKKFPGKGKGDVRFEIYEIGYYKNQILTSH